MGFGKTREGRVLPQPILRVRDTRAYLCGGSRRCDDEMPALRIEENAEADAGSMRLANLRYSLMPCNEAAERLNRLCESISDSSLSLSGATTLVTRPSACASRAVMRSRVNTRCAAVL